MDIASSFGKIVGLLKKYKYVTLVLMLGIALLVIPSKPARASPENTVHSVEETEPDESVEEKLKKTLSCIDGVGSVEVMLTVSFGQEVFYQTNDNIGTSENATTSQREVVTVTDSERNQQAVVKQINPPKYMGAIIVCQGADDSRVQLAVIDAVSKATGLDSNRISVLKMK